ncbi:RNA-directed DNA polymerase, eukaryota [Tanacetum coccineum]
MITVGQTMGFTYGKRDELKTMDKIIGTQEKISFPMNCLSLNIQGLGSKAKKDWIKELISKHKVSFLSIQETKMESVSAMEVKFLWGNYFFDHIISEASGNSGARRILFTWASYYRLPDEVKLDRFLMSNGLLSAFPLISAICLDRHLSDHRPILLKEVFSDFGPTPFRFYHSWLELPGFDDLVSKSWNSFTLDDSIDQGGVTDDILLSRLEVLKQLHDVQSSNNRDIMQKAKILGNRGGRELQILSHAIITKNAPIIQLKILELESPISNEDIRTAVWGCGVDKSPGPDGFTFEFFRDNMSLVRLDETINKMKKMLSRWKLNTLSVGGRLTLLKSVLGSTPIYNMSIFKVPKSVLNYMESLRRNFFNGFQEGDRKIAWVKWSKVLASKKFGGLGVSSFFALNRALLFKWVMAYLSHDNSLWSRIISALHGLNGHVLSAAFNSTWSSIITEVNSLKVKGVDNILPGHISRQ